MMRPVICLILYFSAEEAQPAGLFSDRSFQTANHTDQSGPFATGPATVTVSTSDASLTLKHRRWPTDQDYLADPSLCIF